MEDKDYERAVIELQNALQATPGNAEARLLLGRAFLGKGDPAQAVRQFQVAVQLNPGLTDAHLALADTLNAAENPESSPLAESHASTALSQRPDDPDVLHALAVAEWRQDKRSLAMARLRSALAVAPGHLKSASALAYMQWTIDPKSPAAEKTMRDAAAKSASAVDGSLALARFFQMAGRSSEAEAELRRAVNVAPSNGTVLAELAALQNSSGRRAEAENTLARLSKIPDDRYLTAHAQYLFEGGKREEAIAELQRLWQEHPKSKSIPLWLTRFSLQTGKLVEAEKHIKWISGRDALTPEALELQADLHFRRGRLQEADQTVNRALSARPTSSSGHYLKAQILQAMGKPVEARSALQLALNGNPGMASARVQLSQSLRNARELQQAFQVIDGAPPEQRGDLPIIVERVWVLLAQKRYAVARPDVEKALAMSRNPVTLLQAGLLALQEKRTTAGRAFLEESLILAPGNLEALNAIVLSLAAERQVPAAIERLRQQAAKVPQSAPIQVALGNLLEQTGDLAGARAAYAAARQIDPANEQALVASARMHLVQGQTEEARKMLQDLLSRQPGSVDGLLAMGMLEEGAGRYDQAVQAYRKVLQADPNHVVAKNNLVARLSEQPGSLDEALRLANELRGAASTEPEIEDTIGWVYYRKGSFEPAIEHFSRAAARSRNPRIHYHLAMAHFAAGNRAQGKKAMAAALELDPNLPEAAEVKRMAEQAP